MTIVYMPEHPLIRRTAERRVLDGTAERDFSEATVPDLESVEGM